MTISNLEGPTATRAERRCTGAAEAGPPDDEGAAIRGARILLVEDNPASRLVAVLLLLAAGARVDEAYDGAGALECVTPGRYDLVLLDLMLPGIDGFEVARRLRALPACDDLPIVALTLLDSDADLAACRAAGIDERIVKPVTAGPLLGAVGRRLSRRRL